MDFSKNVRSMTELRDQYRSMYVVVILVLAIFVGGTIFLVRSATRLPLSSAVIGPIGFAIFIPFIFFVAFAVMLLTKANKMRTRALRISKRECCWHCDYPLTGLHEDLSRCPECGNEQAPFVTNKYSRSPLERLHFFLGFPIGGLNGITLPAFVLSALHGELSAPFVLISCGLLAIWTLIGIPFWIRRRKNPMRPSAD